VLLLLAAACAASSAPGRQLPPPGRRLLADCARALQVPTAHRGFLARSRTINIDQLHSLAEASGKRLVLCGHSLGGAVATLCTLRLLRELEPLSPNVRCAGRLLMPDD
jgi:pimeloyl-ACP methyl ester carboxylesterase